jgi:AraC-like DNA-binding protein
MWLDFYMFLTLASGIALAVWGWQLCSIHIPHREDTHRLRTARAILAASYFILAIPAFCELFNGGEADRKIIAVFTIAVAAYQSLLFTVTLLTFIQPLCVIRHRVRIQAGIVTVAVAMFLFMALTSEECWVFFVALAVYAVQLVCYTLLFRRKYAECLRLLEEYYDEDQHARLRWTKFGFYAALSVGIAASLSVWLPPVAYNIFTVGYILFYGWFAGRFCNYVVKINYYLPAVTQGQEPVRLQAVDMAACGLSEPELAAEKEHLRLALERWVAERRFTRPEEGREQIARELGTTKEFLCWYFKNEIGRDFRPWRVGLRIEYAKQLLAEELGISMNDLARKVGFATKSNFYGYFKKLTGETPVEYQRRIVSQC